MQGDNISAMEGCTVGDNSSTCTSGRIASELWGIASVLWGIPSVVWRLFSTVGDNNSTVEVA